MTCSVPCLSFQGLGSEDLACSNCLHYNGCNDRVGPGCLKDDQGPCVFIDIILSHTDDSFVVFLQNCIESNAPTITTMQLITSSVMLTYDL